MRIDLFRKNGFDKGVYSTEYSFFEYKTPTYEQYKNVSGVYVLIKNRQIVYIGVSRDLYTRIRSHVTSEIIDFDLICVIVDEAQLVSPYLMEEILINIFIPKHNKKIPKVPSRNCLKYDDYTTTVDIKSIKNVFESKESKMERFIKNNREMFKQLSEL